MPRRVRIRRRLALEPGVAPGRRDSELGGRALGRRPRKRLTPPPSWSVATISGSDHRPPPPAAASDLAREAGRLDPGDGNRITPPIVPARARRQLGRSPRRASAPSAAGRRGDRAGCRRTDGGWRRLRVAAAAGDDHDQDRQRRAGEHDDRDEPPAAIDESRARATGVMIPAQQVSLGAGAAGRGLPSVDAFRAVASPAAAETAAPRSQRRLVSGCDEVRCAAGRPGVARPPVGRAGAADPRLQQRPHVRDAVRARRPVPRRRRCGRLEARRRSAAQGRPPSGSGRRARAPGSVAAVGLLLLLAAQCLLVDGRVSIGTRRPRRGPRWACRCPRESEPPRARCRRAGAWPSRLVPCRLHTPAPGGQTSA